MKMKKTVAFWSEVSSQQELQGWGESGGLILWLAMNLEVMEQAIGHPGTEDLSAPGPVWGCSAERTS